MGKHSGDCCKNTVSFATLGCKTNQFESVAMREQLENAGYRVMPFSSGAELVIINTCTVTSATDAQSRNLVRRARRLNPECRVVVTGCYAQVTPRALTALPGVDLVIGNEEKNNLLKFLQETSSTPVAVADIRAVRTAAIPVLSSHTERSRAYVQIQNGCDAFCSYCIIPHARGPSRSALPEQVVVQLGRLAEQGAQEVVLTGIHVGNYGIDLQPPSSLLELLQRIERETSIQRLRLGSIEPTELASPLLDYLAKSRTICPHLHIPLQSGDDAVLARMHRPYGREWFHGLIRQITSAIPDIAIGLDVIAGFPGETEDEFANTVKLIDELPVSHLHVFPFSSRPGTLAAEMPGHLPGDVKRSRAEKLRRLGEEKLSVYAERFVGRELEVVVEGGVKGSLLKGVSRNYLEVYFQGAGTSSVGQTVKVRAVSAECGKIRACLEMPVTKSPHSQEQ